MTTPDQVVPAEVRWRTYLKALTFLTPALVLWVMTGEFFVPKLLLLWRMGGGAETEAQWIVDGVVLLAHCGGYIFAAIVVAAILGEWRSRFWRRHRTTSLVGLVFLVNFVVLVGIWSTCLAVLLIAPALGPGK